MTLPARNVGRIKLRPQRNHKRHKTELRASNPAAQPPCKPYDHHGSMFKDQMRKKRKASCKHVRTIRWHVSSTSSAETPLVLAFQTPTFGIVSGTSTQRMRCDAASPFPILLPSLFHCPRLSGIWFLPSFHDGQWCSLCFSVTSSKKKKNSTLLFARPPNVVQSFSAPILLPRPVFSSHCGACLSTIRWYSFAVWPGLAPVQNSFFQLLTFVFRCLILAMDQLQKHILQGAAGRPPSCPQAPAPQVTRACRCGHCVPRSGVSHMTAPAGPLTCLHVCTSEICFVHAFCCSLLHLPIPHAFRPKRAWPCWIKSSSTSISVTYMKRDNEPDAFLPADCRLNFNLSMGEVPTACPRPHSRRDQEHHQQLHHTTPHIVLLEDAISSGIGEPHITLLLSGLHFCSQLLRARSQVHSWCFDLGCKTNSSFYCIPGTSLPDSSMTQSPCSSLAFLLP